MTISSRTIHREVIEIRGAGRLHGGPSMPGNEPENFLAQHLPRRHVHGLRSRPSWSIPVALGLGPRRLDDFADESDIEPMDFVTLPTAQAGGFSGDPEAISV